MSSEFAAESITDNLLNVFNYSFVETAPYGFFIPKEDKYVPVNLVDKVYHCLGCGKDVQVKYHHTGVTYFSKERFEKQKTVYFDLNLPFPSAEEVAAEKEFTCHVRGYCEDCADNKLENSLDDEQSAVNLCLQIHKADEELVRNAKKMMGSSIKSWLGKITESSQLLSYDLSSYEALRDLLCAVILEDTSSLEAALAGYKQELAGYFSQIEELMEDLPSQWTAYAKRPTAAYESMSDEIYHEYTVVFPEKTTVPQDFFVYRSIEKNKIRMFLQQPRIETKEQLLMEAGFDAAWVDWLVDHATSLSH